MAQLKQLCKELRAETIYNVSQASTQLAKSRTQLQELGCCCGIHVLRPTRRFIGSAVSRVDARSDALAPCSHALLASRRVATSGPALESSSSRLRSTTCTTALLIASSGMWATRCAFLPMTECHWE